MFLVNAAFIGNSGLFVAVGEMQSYQRWWSKYKYKYKSRIQIQVKYKAVYIGVMATRVMEEMQSYGSSAAVLSHVVVQLK